MQADGLCRLHLSVPTTLPSSRHRCGICSRGTTTSRTSSPSSLTTCAPQPAGWVTLKRSTGQRRRSMRYRPRLQEGGGGQTRGVCRLVRAEWHQLLPSLMALRKWHCLMWKRKRSLPRYPRHRRAKGERRRGPRLTTRYGAHWCRFTNHVLRLCRNVRFRMAPGLGSEAAAGVRARGGKVQPLGSPEGPVPGLPSSAVSLALGSSCLPLCSCEGIEPRLPVE